MPKISVLMSVYNNARYLRPAIDSILGQTIGDFEFIIVDDGSGDATPAILDTYTDPRIVRLTNETNLGLTNSLNRGLDIMRGDYFTRMDDDDISVPDRFARQLAYLDAHPEVGLVGSNMVSIGAEGEILNNGKPEFGAGATHGYLDWTLYWTNPVPHVTIFMRRPLLTAHHLRYDPAFNTVEEFELWTRLIQHTRFARMEDILIQRRILPTSVTRSRRPEQMQLHYQLGERQLSRLLGHTPDAAALQTVINLIGREATHAEYFPAATDILLKSYFTYREKYPLTAAEDTQIRGDIVGYLLRMARLSQGGKPAYGLYPLWALRRISRREFFSRNTASLMLKLLRGK